MGVFDAIGRTLVLFAALSATVGIAIASDAAVTIITLGDSDITGYGLAPADGFPAQLEAALKRNGRLVTVMDTGFHDTSRVGFGWLTKTEDGSKLLADPAIRAAIIELGSNDCKQFAVDKTRVYLDRILNLFAEKNVPVLLVGSAPYDFCSDYYGAGYTAAYRQIFPDLAKKYGDPLYADFKEGITGHPELFQDDHDHANAKGVAIIVEKILPSVLALITRVEEQ